MTADLRVMVAIWRGDTPWQDALRTETLKIEGPTTTRPLLNLLTASTAP